MQSAYIPVLIYAALVMAFPAVTLVLAKFIRPASTSFGAKLKPYECGIPPESDARGRYSVRFFIVAMLFVIFDVETMFLIPWAILYKGWVAAHQGLFALVSMVLFLGILLVGYLWLYKKGALEWA
ncbi:MAG: NADH-quinone oxidoreductase subunit A [Acidobacteria bacterium]|jgi:NADH-quinone oxidoreductase subunit A|nr:MAG: NADH-quinone oxidoreductase subunit A [Acidobacteria bacterium 13_1_20CM_58_21]PYU43303.1 MAG: NADH-quinone oxidoreductase subunit A [Acidobacteriota bacterium]PYU54937.1 MAG: NADH-quinone oxidoreductase subunit A [Acidobacteriota bacterium]PYU63378.1 MAG: NADH-quinone oxidoreductase subunit A [Acidobacteriota bacterium]PYU74826.1 MAG: NADH-quinone oxidoreductase subunit A [Acidobacteriota bacterium]